MPEQSFGEWLREQRGNCGLSQEKAGKRIGVSGAAVSGWESGATSPDPSRFAEIEATYFLAPGTVASMLKPPSEGPSLDYWVGRWEQQTMHFRRVLADQEELLLLMRRKAGLAEPTDTEAELTAIEATQREAVPAPTP